jgi:hypothetical protein
MSGTSSRGGLDDGRASQPDPRAHPPQIFGGPGGAGPAPGILSSST